jgi:hypothetical protein
MPIERHSLMGEYRTIKELVIDTCIGAGAFPEYEKLTTLVKQHFPDSKWQKTHYAWYKSQIKSGDIVVPGWVAADNEHNAEGDNSEADIAAAIEGSIEASVSLERDLHSYFSRRVDVIEPGLTIEPGGVECVTEVGRVDLLAKDRHGVVVVIELKAGKAKDESLGQLLGYMGCLTKSPNSVRGILVASSFDSRVQCAARALPLLKLLKYSVSFAVEEVP